MLVSYPHIVRQSLAGSELPPGVQVLKFFVALGEVHCTTSTTDSTNSYNQRQYNK